MNFPKSNKPKKKDQYYPKEYTKDIREADPEWKSLDMRRPGGVGILDLQKISHKGYLVEPKVSGAYLDPHFIDDKFTHEEIQAFKEAFAFFDREGDGTMSLEDLGLALRSQGFIVTENEIKDLVNKYNPDGRHDAISLKDFYACIIDVSNKVDGSEIIRQCFSVLDKDDVGIIHIDEFRHVMKSLGDSLSNEELNALLKELDLYGDNYIRIDDLVELLSTH